MKQVRFAVRSNTRIAKDVYEMTLDGDTSALTAPGQFVNIKIDGLFLRRPISVCRYGDGTMTLIYKVVGKGTERMKNRKAGDEEDVLVGLGNGFDTAKSGDSPLLIGGGVGTPPMLGLCEKLVSEGKNVTALLGFNSKQEVFYEEEFIKAGARTFIATADGTYGEKGFVTDKIKSLLDEGKKYDCIFAVGPLPMMKAVCALTKKYGVKTIVSMNTIMVDGTGMCGSCRLTVDGKVKYACVDGPEFDGHLVDFDEAINRSKFYKEQEKEHVCRLTGEIR